MPCFGARLSRSISACLLNSGSFAEWLPSRTGNPRCAHESSHRNMRSWPVERRSATNTGRIVVSVYTLIGKTIWEEGKAPFRDRIALVGHHGYENFFSYCWAYYSDDEGRTWQPNDDRTHDAGGSEPPTMADVAGKASCVESRGLARVPQGPHRCEIDPLRGHGSRGAVLRVDRQPDQTSR